MRPIAATATTAVISPRGQDSAWPRQMIQARMNGAAAAASSSQRMIVWTSHPLSERPPPPPVLPLISTNLFSRWYQGRNSPTASRTPPTIATISERVRPSSGIGRAPYLATAGDDDRHGGAHVARRRGAAQRAAERGERVLRRAPAEAVAARPRRRERLLEHAARVADLDDVAHGRVVLRAVGRELELHLDVVARARGAHPAPDGQRRAGGDGARRGQRQAVGVVGGLA